MIGTQTYIGESSDSNADTRSTTSQILVVPGEENVPI